MASRLKYIVVVALVTFSTAWAVGTAKPSTKNVSKEGLPALGVLDKDNDGLISRDEGFANEDVSKYWDKLDTNLDGNLDKAEFAMLESEVKREETLKTDHPQDVQQYENGQYISPKQQIERNKQDNEQ